MKNKTYLLAYTVRTTRYAGGESHKDTDHFEVFADENDNLDAARKRLEELENSFTKYLRKGIYTWNICEVIATSEHYETEEK